MRLINSIIYNIFVVQYHLNRIFRFIFRISKRNATFVMYRSCVCALTVPDLKHTINSCSAPDPFEDGIFYELRSTKRELIISDRAHTLIDL